MQVSAPQLLVGGQSYWFRTRHVNFGSSGYFELALRVGAAGNAAATALLTSPAQLRANSVPSIQTISLSTNVTREVQRITVRGAASGAFTLTVGGVPRTDSTGNPLTLSASASASAVQSFVSAANPGGCNNIGVVRTAVAVNVTGGAGVVFNSTGYAWDITFNCPTDAGTYPAIVPYSTSLAPQLGGGGIVLHSERTQLASAPLSGYFNLSLPGYFGNATTGAISARAGPSDIIAAIANLDPSISVDVTGGTNKDASSWQLTFWSPNGALPLLVASTTAMVNGSLVPTLLGTSASYSAAWVWEGSADPFYWPTPMDWFSAPLAAPAVLVTSNGITGSCDVTTFNASAYAAGSASGSSCDWTYVAALTPTLVSASVSNVTARTVLTLSGSGFLPSSAGVGRGVGGTNLQAWDLNTVFFVPAGAPLAGPYASACNVTASTATSITCVVLDSPAGVYTVGVLVGFNGGYALPPVNGSLPTVSYAASLSSVQPASGSTAGGTLLRLVGTGFRRGTNGNISGDIVTIGGSPCAIVSSSVTVVTCLTPPGNTLATAVAVNGVLTGFYFNYSPAMTATVTSISPSVLSSALSGVIKLTIRTVGNVIASGAMNASIAIGTRSCSVKNTTVSPSSPSDTAVVTCILLRGPPPPLPQAPIAPLVTVGAWGYASLTSPSIALDVSYRINAISTAVGSLAGGSVINFTGVGIATIPHQVLVSFTWMDNWNDVWTMACPLTAIATDGTWATCQLGVPPAFKRGAGGPMSPLSGSLVFKVNNVTAPCGPSGALSCPFAQNLTNTPVIAASTLLAAGVGGGSAYGLADVSAVDRLVLTGTNLRVPGTVVNISDGVEWYPCVNGTTVSGAGTNLTAGITNFVCTPQPAGAVGFYTVTVTVQPLGIALGDVNYTYPLVLASAAPLSATRGGVQGGTLVTVSGAGFAAGQLSRNVVTFGGAPGLVLSASATSLTVLTPVYAAKTVSVSVIVLDASGDGFAAGNVTLPGAFTFDSTLAFTPQLLSVAPSSGAAGTSVVMRGAGFSNGTAPPSVVIGGAPCVLTSFNDTYVICTLGATPAGVQPVQLTVPGKGLASPLRSFNSLLNVTSVQGGAAGTSLMGGAVLTFQGVGFPLIPDPAATSTSTTASASVVACNAPCAVTSSNYTTLTCLTGALTSAEALSSLALYVPMALSGRSVSPASQAALAFDGSGETTFRACAVTMDMGSATLAVVTSVFYYPAFGQQANLVGGVYAGSLNGVNWTTIATLPGTIHQGWNEVLAPGWAPGSGVDLSTFPTYRYLRFSFASGASCVANAIQFNGIPVAAPPIGGFAAGCPVNLTVTASSALSQLLGKPAPAALTVTPTLSTPTVVYAVASTPVITGISPAYGTALGGDVVTITGVGFPSSAASVIVALNGMPCTVTRAASTSVTCTTSARTSIQSISVALVVNGVGLAAYDASRVFFRYLDRWSALTTWQYGEPPGAGDSVVVPEGQAILVDVNPPKLNLVLVQGDLVFADEADLSFNASYIYVQGGRFEVGSEATPFTHKLVITLHGDRFTSVEIPDIGAKVLAVSNRDGMAMGGGGFAGLGQVAMTTSYAYGALELHGQPRLRVWTRLAAPASAGSYSVTVAENVDYAPGETIIVTNTYGVGAAEEMTVAYLSSPRVVVFTTPLANAHDCKVVSAGQFGFADVNMCGEVGLLSRNVVIQGDDNSVGQLYGVHTGAFMGGIYHIENVELRHCGQQGNLGRYCSHFHMTANNPNSYVRANSIHDSFQRAVTIHATSYATVADNFAWRIAGHSIFVEDGVETNNVISGNLVGSTTACHMCISSDSMPANFWMSSPSNFWRSNIAAGSVSFGYWFELPGNPNGPSYSPSYCPVNQPLGEFFNNTAHSSGIGLRIYPQFFPTVNGDCGGGATAPAYFENNTLFHNSLGMFHKHVGDLHHVNARYIENGNDISWVHYQNTPFGWNPNLDNVLFMCTSSGTCGRGSRAITAPQEEFWSARGLTFVNYGSSPTIAGCNACDSAESYKQGGYTYRWERLQWFNSPLRVTSDDPNFDIHWDIDGSMSGAGANSSVTPYRKWLNLSSGCAVDTVGTFSHGVVCNAANRVRRLQINNYAPFSLLQGTNINVTSAAGWGPMMWRAREVDGWVLPAVANSSFALNWPSVLSDWQMLTLRYSEPEYVAIVPGEFLVLNFSWVEYRYRTQVKYGASNIDVPSLPHGVTLDPINNAIGTGTLPDDQNKSFSMVINSLNATDASDSTHFVMTLYDQQCAPGGCPTPPPPSLGNATLWSDAGSWPGGVLPVAGQDVLINATRWIIMDINPPKLGKLTIQGRLEFQDGHGPRLLQVDSIVNWGQFVIGNATVPFAESAEIVLSGTATSPVVIIDDNLFLGNKMIVNVGVMTIAGQRVSVPWARLAATAAASTSTLVLDHAVEGIWGPGDRIVVGPTDYGDFNTGMGPAPETATIAAVHGSTVTLTAPLAQRHFGGSLGLPGRSLSLGAVVAHLSRNIVIRGNLTSRSDGWGATVFNTVVSRPSPIDLSRTVNFAGQMDLRYVEVRRHLCGAVPECPASLGKPHHHHRHTTPITRSSATAASCRTPHSPARPARSGPRSASSSAPSSSTRPFRSATTRPTSRASPSRTHWARPSS